MSIRAIDWVFQHEVKPSSFKLVLLALADNASDTGLAYPSTETISRKTNVSRTSVKVALDSLVERGWLEDTGKRVGRTHQIKVYRLRWANEQPKGAESDLLKGSESDLLDDGKGSDFDGKGSKTDRLRGRKLTPEPSEEPSDKKKSSDHSDKPNGHRLSKRNGTVDSEWLARLVNDNAYSGIDVSREFGKMSNWCKVHRKLPTRARFVNWLNRIEVLSNGIQDEAEKPEDRGPEGWETVAHELYPRMNFPKSFWDITSPEVMERIKERLAA